jgi:glycosyltransferase involved in cell wall biosynthesis
MLNILMITPNIRCGIDIYTENLVRELKKKAKISINSVPLKPGFFRFYVLGDIIKKKSDIVHIQHEIMTFDRFLGLTAILIFLYTFLTRRKTITTFHTVKSIANFETEIASQYRKNRFLMFLAKHFIKYSFTLVSFFSDQIIVLTKNARDVLEKEYEIRNAVYIPHGFFNPTKVNEKELYKFRASLGIGPNDKVILLFGFAYEFKGYHHVIKSLPSFLKNHPETKLVITGSVSQTDPKQCENYLSILKKMAKSLNLEHNVIFTNYIPDEEVPTLITSSDVVIFPYDPTQSASGTVSTVLPYKKPIIVSNTPAFDFLENGVDCIKVNVKEEKELASSIGLLFDNPVVSNRLRKNIERKVRDMSIENVAEEHMHIYKCLVHRGLGQKLDKDL